MTTKKFAYLFLAASILIAGYFVYDTIKIVNSDDPDELLNDTDGNSSGSGVNIKYNEYEINKNLDYALAEKDDTSIKLYFYDEEIQCTDENIFRAGNEDLLLLVEIPLTALGTEKAQVTTTSLFNRDPAGSYLEITGVPNKTNEVEIKEEDGKYKGELSLIWENREYAGKFEVVLCSASTEIAE